MWKFSDLKCGCKNIVLLLYNPIEIQGNMKIYFKFSEHFRNIFWNFPFFEEIYLLPDGLNKNNLSVS